MKKLDHKKLAEGEVTGHYHEAVANDATLFGDGNSMLLDAPNGTDVKHQEHSTLTVPPGQYDRLLAQEFDPFEEEIRSVKD